MSTPVPDRSVGGDLVAEQLRAAIVAGDFAPGQRLVEADLCARFEAGRATVRTALAALAHEGLVERIAHRGARVRAVSLDEAVAITEVRMAVEGLCAAKAAEKIDPAGARQLREIGTEMQQAVRAGETMTYSMLNRRLHALVRTIADQPVATDVVATLLARNVRHHFQLALRPGRPQVSLPEHLAIIDEVCAGNPGAAERAARRHLASVIEALRQSGDTVAES